jgi:hypothetical protein
VSEGSIDYDRWYPEVPAVLDTNQLADLLHTSEQIIRAWVREGIIPAHRPPAGASSRSSAMRSSTGSSINRYEPE